MDLSGFDIQTERLHLRAYREVDCDDIHAQVTPTLARYNTFEPSKSVDELRAIARGWLVAQKAGTSVFAVVRQRDTDAFVGMSGLHYRDDPEPEIGIWIREDLHRQGYGREAVAALVRYAGEVLGESSVVYPVVDENRASRALVEGLGGVIFERRTLKKPSGAEFPLIVYRVPTP